MVLALVAVIWANPVEAAVRTATSAAEFDAAVVQASPGDEIVVSRGTYYLWRPLWMHTPRVTIRGATGNRDDVVLHGTGMNNSGVNEGFSVGANDVVIRDLTVKDFYWNGIHTRAENNVDRTVISNVRTWNIGERHIKGSRNSFDAYTMSDDILIENVFMLQTVARDHRGNPDYIGGIDMMAVNRLVVRRIVAQGIRGHFNGGNAAIFLWNGVTGVLLEKNRIFDCAKGIALGNPYRPGPFPGTGGNGQPGEHHARGGIIRNNMVRRGVWTGGNHIGLELASTRDIRVYQNTFYSDSRLVLPSGVHLARRRHRCDAERAAGIQHSARKCVRPRGQRLERGRQHSGWNWQHGYTELVRGSDNGRLSPQRVCGSSD